MNSTIKTILLTLLTLSVLTIAMIEVSGISEKKLSNMFGSDTVSSADRRSEGVSEATANVIDPNQVKKDREAKMRDMEKTEVRVQDSIFDFGTIKDGDKVSHTYTVTNIGDKPLYIANVAASCGCTVPEFPKEAIAPGETGQVTLEFNSSGKRGTVAKNALIVANAINAPYSIGFKAEVE